MNDNDKLALIDGSAKVQTQIEIRPLIVGETSLILREYDYISKWDMEDYKYVPNHGFIGQFVERILNVSLKNLPTDAKFENKELVLKLGVLTDDGVTWYSLGNFLIYEAKYDDVAGLWNLKGKDFCKKFNKKYEDTITYPCTALQLATNVCSQCGCSLATTNFKNKDFVINENQFVNGETCREVMKAIGMLAFTWVRIGWDNRVYLDFDKKTTVDPKNKITNDNYYNLKVTREVYGPVNRILIGLSNVTGENAYVEDAESIENNGLCELDLYDNPLTYTEELRKLAIENASGLLGLTYTPVELNTTGYPWLNGNELIEIVDMENGSLQTYAFDRRIEYFGHIKSSIKAQSISNVESTYKYNGSIKERIKRTEISVDKANGKISLVAETVDTIEKETTPTGQASGSNIHISDSADAELLDFKLYGKSTQETTTGKNLFNYQSANVLSNVEPSATLTGVGNDFTITASTNGLLAFPVGLIDYNTIYRYMTNAYLSSSISLWVTDNPTYSNWSSYSQSRTQITSNWKSTSHDLSNYQGKYLWIQLRGNSSGYAYESVTYTDFILSNQSVSKYEPYTGAIPQPNPNYPSEIKSVGYQNLFNGWKIGQRINATTGELYDSDVSAVSNDYIPVDFEKNPNYYLDGLSDQLFSLVGAYDKDKNFLGRTPAGGKTYYSLNENSFTSNHVEGTIAYLLVSIYENNSLSGTIDLVNDLKTMLNVGNTAKNYIPFGKYGVEVDTIGANFLNISDTTYTSNGVTATIENGIMIAIGTMTSNFFDMINVLYFDKELPAGTYTFSIDKPISNAELHIRLLGDDNEYYTIQKNAKSVTFTTTEPKKRFRIFATASTNTTIDFTIKPQLEFGTEATPFDNYKITTTLIQSDHPLMSNKDESVRDYLYLQNGNLHLKKYINEIVLNGSETWNIQSINSYGIANFVITNLGIPYASNVKPIYSNYFKNQTTTIANTQTEGIMNSNITSLYIRIKSSTASTVEQFKTWLSENNVKVQYELAEPQDILIAENVDSLITYKNVTNISTTDNLQPNMEVVYVKDNTLNDIYQTQNGMNKYYTKVENDAQLEITDEQIESSVTKIESAMGTIESNLETLKSTYLSQTADQFEILFKETGIKEIVDSVDKLTKSNNATLVEQEQWIRFKGGNIELGRSDSQVKLLLSNDRISFMTGGNESAYISNNQLYITDSTILNKLQVGHWETIEEDGNLNTRWIEGVI